LVKPSTFRVICTGWLASVGFSVAEVSNITVSVLVTSTSVGSLVTDRLGVGTVEIVIMATWTAAK